MGYSLTQSAYLCLDLPSNKLYTSRHVEFVEDKFPFSLSSSPSSYQLLPDPSIHTSLPTPPPVEHVLPTPPASAPPHIVTPPPTAPTHSMITRARNNITKPNPMYFLTSTVTSDIEPTTVKQALSDSCWRDAMSAEFSALLKNGTWDLVSSDPSQNVVGCKWVSLDQEKARWLC